MKYNNEEEIKKLIEDNLKRNKEKKEESKNIKIIGKENGILIPLIFILISVIFFSFLMKKYDYKGDKEETKYYQGKVKSIEKVENNASLLMMDDDGQEYITDVLNKPSIYMEVEVLDGDLKGQTVKVEKAQLDDRIPEKREIKEGDIIIIVHTEIAGEATYHFVSFDYRKKTTILIVVFIILVLSIARVKGFTTLSLLGLIGFAIIKIYIPAILCGVNIYVATIVLSLYSIIFGMIIINGLNTKTYSAILGNIIGIAIAALLAYMVNNIFNISGIVSEEAVYLLHIENMTFDLAGFVWAGTLIGALGAIMDTALSIASSIREISKSNNEISLKKMFLSGMEVGKDAISTMISTLILAYISGALIQTVLLSTYLKPSKYLLNTEAFISEITKGIIGAIGILVTVPATAVLASLFEVIENKKNNK